jgi:molecular chaperone GrpE
MTLEAESEGAMYRLNKRRREENYLFGPGWPEESFGRRAKDEEIPEPKPPEPEKANAEEERYLRLIQSLQADFANYRHRVEREREDQAKYANRELILKVLPIMDDFARALGTVPQEMTDAGWVQGMALIERKLTAILEEEGLKRIEAEGKDFDPWEHEAVFTVEGNGDDEGRVTSIIREGYKLYDKVIRPAQVSVFKSIQK